MDYAENTGVDCIAIDQTILVQWAKDNFRKDAVIQGNLDNALLFSSKSDIGIEVRKILDCFVDKPLIFNLGHGILPKTPIENLGYLIDVVKNYKKDERI